MAKHKITRKYSQQVEWLFRKNKNANLLAKPGVNDFIIVLDGLSPNFNIGKIFRSAEAFGCKEIHIINTSMFDVAPAKGAFKRVPAKFYNDFEQRKSRLLELGFTIYALYPSETDILQKTDLAEKSAFVVGHEENGISFNPNQHNNIIPLSIKQFGQTESLNVAVCASLCMYEYTNQHSK